LRFPRFRDTLARIEATVIVSNVCCPGRGSLYALACDVEVHVALEVDAAASEVNFEVPAFFAFRIE